MPLSVLFIHAPSAAFAEGPVLGSANIAARRIGGVGRVAPPTPLGFWRHLPRASFLGELHVAARRGRGHGARLAPSLFASRGDRGFPPAGFATFARTKVGKGLLGYKARQWEKVPVGQGNPGEPRQSLVPFHCWKVTNKRYPLVRPGRTTKNHIHGALPGFATFARSKVGEGRLGYEKAPRRAQSPPEAPRQSLEPFHCWKVTSKRRPTPRPGRTTGKLYPWVRGFPPAGFATFARSKVEKSYLNYKARQWKKAPRRAQSPPEAPRQSLEPFHCWKVTNKRYPLVRPGRTIGKPYPWAWGVPWRVLPLLPGQKWRKVGLVTKRGNGKKHPAGHKDPRRHPGNLWYPSIAGK